MTFLIIMKFQFFVVVDLLVTFWCSICTTQTCILGGHEILSNCLASSGQCSKCWPRKKERMGKFSFMSFPWALRGSTLPFLYHLNNPWDHKVAQKQQHKSSAPSARDWMLMWGLLENITLLVTSEDLIVPLQQHTSVHHNTFLLVRNHQNINLNCPIIQMDCNMISSKQQNHLMMFFFFTRPCCVQLRTTLAECSQRSYCLLPSGMLAPPSECLTRAQESRTESFNVFLPGSMCFPHSPDHKYLMLINLGLLYGKPNLDGLGGFLEWRVSYTLLFEAVISAHSTAKTCWNHSVCTSCCTDLNLKKDHSSEWSMNFCL